VFVSLRLIQVVRLLVAFGLVAIILAGIVGQVVRDRYVATAILFYLPLLPASLIAVVVDLARRGRALPHARFLLALLGVVGATWAAIPMIGSGAIGAYGPTDAEVTLLHWNVLWGGGPFRSEQTWAAERAEIRKRDPDLVILSELPRAEWLARLVDELGPGATVVGIEHDPSSPYWFRIGMCSRWPIRLEKRMPLPGGVAMSVACEVRGRAVRVLVVDGKSNPFASRLPFLQAIAELCRAAAREGRPFDAVAGDFNTPGRSIGFDSFLEQGYTLASRSAAGWRGTFPSFLPVYDIDHVWLRPGLRLRSCTVFTGAASDHRGQFVSVLLKSPEATADDRWRSQNTGL
jgi:endonuclease/exonuclease/phosphatase family metal-dependent hydrolase